MKDLTVIYQPDGACDFFVHGSDRYVVVFSDPKVFGASLATLKKGNNLFSRLNNGQTECQIISETAALAALDTEDVASAPVVIPPKGPGPRRIL